VSVDGQSRGHGLKTTVDHALIRGLITAGPDASRSFLCLGTSVGPGVRLLVEARVLLPWSCPQLCPNPDKGYAGVISFPAYGDGLCYSLGHPDFVRNRPDKAGELAGDCRGDGRDRFASPAKLAILKAEPLLRLPSDCPDRR